MKDESISNFLKIIILFLFFIFFIFNFNIVFAGSESGTCLVSEDLKSYIVSSDTGNCVKINTSAFNEIDNFLNIPDIYIDNSLYSYLLDTYDVDLTTYSYYTLEYILPNYSYQSGSFFLGLFNCDVSVKNSRLYPINNDLFFVFYFNTVSYKTGLVCNIFRICDWDNDGYASVYSQYSNCPYFSNKNMLQFDNFPFDNSSFPIPTQNYTLYIDDFNLFKRFRFEFKIPLLKEDTKIFCFLEKYKRNSYDSVTADFKFYTVSTPEGYDYTNYKNYMYYDDEDKKLYLPAGCQIQCYKCSANNGDLYNLELFNEYVAERPSFSYDYWSLTDKIYEYMIKDNIMTYEEYDFETLFSQGIVSSYTDYLRYLNNYNSDVDINVLNYLFPTKANFIGFNFQSVVLNLYDSLGYKSLTLSNVANSFGFSSFTEMYYQTFKEVLYYSYRGVTIKDINRFSDFAFSTTPIYSYESEKNPYNKTGSFYELFRNTKVYTMNNKINGYTFRINYSDSQDVTSMLPEGTDTDYLTSPFYKGNENSSSGGNITYDIQEIIQGDKVIDYSKEDNSIHNDIKNTYIENWIDGDNITINKTDNPSIDKIYNTSQDILGILRLMYISILQIQTRIGNFGDLISNTTNNFTYNINNQIEYLVVPNKTILKNDLKEMSDATDKHLGILAQGTDFLLFVGTLYYNIDEPEQIVLHIPEISIWEHTLISEMNFNFTNFMTNDLPFLGTMHNMYLTAVDLFFLWILIGFAEKVYNKFTGNGGE